MNAAKSHDHLRRLAIVAAGAAVVPLLMTGTASASNGPTQVSAQAGAYLAAVEMGVASPMWKQCIRAVATDVHGPQTTGCPPPVKAVKKAPDLQGLLSSLA